MPPPFHLETTLALPVPPERLWPFLSDTEAVNRAVGLPSVTYRVEPLPDGGTRTWASARLYGIPLEWEEKPFEWMEGQRYEVERIFTRGPIDRIRAGVRFAADGTGTRVAIYGDFTARQAWLVPFVRILGGRQIAKMAALFTRVAQMPVKEAVSLPEGPIRVDRDAIEAIRSSLAGSLSEAERRILNRLADDLLSLPDSKVLCIRPFAWADPRGFAHVPTLTTFLHATKAGLLDMDWTIICPHCRGKTAAVSKLAELPAEGECPTCRVRFAVEFDRAVEARFSVAPMVRRATAGIFCRGGPMNTPFIKAQYRIPPGGACEVAAASLAGRTHLRTTGPLETTPVAPGKTRFENRTGREIVLSVEEADEPGAATAALVSTLPAFQDLFAADVLAAGQEIAVRRLTVLFSDLKGSTALYREIGDARAYAMVREHFRVFEEILAEHDGILVKTIGDSVMAVFLAARDAVAAAELAHAAFKAPILLKIGLHTGPLLAVSANRRNDYFGTTVNIAARLKELAGAGEIIISAEVADEVAAPGERESVVLKGIEFPVEVLRLMKGTAAGLAGVP